LAFSPRPDLQLFFDRLTRRSVLTDDEQQAILALPGHAAQNEAGRDIVRLGVRVDHACLIVAGLVGRFGQNADGGRQFTAIHIPGDMADLHSVVQPQTTTGLEALSVTTIVRIPHVAIRATAARYPAIAEAFWRDCMVDAAILSQWVVNVGRRDARARLAHLLCEVVMRLGPDRTGPDFRFSFAVTQAQLADATGLTPVHVNRVLKSMREDGIADVRQREVRIMDWDGLVAAGEFEPEYLQLHIQPQHRLRIVRAT
jgi:CRP-like cAMP-binding protein